MPPESVAVDNDNLLAAADFDCQRQQLMFILALRLATLQLVFGKREIDEQISDLAAAGSRGSNDKRSELGRWASV